VTQDEIIEMAQEVGMDYLQFISLESMEKVIRFVNLMEIRAADKAVAAEREAIQDEYWMRVSSDLENGVKSLNEKAAERFTTYFPELSTFGSWLEERGEA
jgi:glutamine phosphoribosylpyrophosphate amidotransferase